ncbi:hypothetical protein DENSPDRAFT_834214 [Dentipellis sp. KUC8613]|nr:hypothetical protein DENSPDRAFT_834214 [Dentipellis sp. KUC8613]
MAPLLLSSTSHPAKSTANVSLTTTMILVSCLISTSHLTLSALSITSPGFPRYSNPKTHLRSPTPHVRVADAVPRL